jgi:hypothetical protein
MKKRNEKKVSFEASLQIEALGACRLYLKKPRTPKEKKQFEYFSGLITGAVMLQKVAEVAPKEAVPRGYNGYVMFFEGKY